jgi:hypothetical protein
LQASDISIYYTEHSKDGVFVPNLSPTYTRCVLIGHQVITKSKSQSASPDFVMIIMVVVRLVDIATDIVFTLNNPVDGFTVIFYFY